MKQLGIRWFVAIIFILWLFFVLATFFAVQKPFNQATATAISRDILDLLVAGWVALVGWGLGSWLLEWLLPTPHSQLEGAILGTGLGLGFLGLLSLGVGLAGLFQPALAYTLTIVLTFPLLWRGWRQKFRRPPVSLELPNRWISFYLGATVFLMFLWGLLPPTDWDGLFYHLTGPKLYLEAGRVFGGLDVPHFNFPSLMEMLFAWTMLLRGDVAAKLLHLVFGLLLTGLVYLVARQLLGPKAGWRAVLILVSMPMLITLAGWAYNDLALAFYQLASLYSIINYQLVMNKEEEISPEPGQLSSLSPAPYSLPSARSWLLLCGIFAGMAMGLKYTSFVTPLVVVGLIGMWGWRKGSRGESGGKRLEARTTHHAPRTTYYALHTTFLDLLLFSLTALLVASPWYLKNWAFTGNPVYPFLSGVFGGQFWDSFRAAWYASAGTGIGWRPGTLLALPWLLTLGVRDANYWDGRTGPLWLLFLPLIFLLILPGVRRRLELQPLPAAVVALLVYSLAHYGFWTMGVIWSRSLFQSRLLLPGLVGLVPLAGWAWLHLEWFDLPQFSLSRFINIAAGLTLALTLIDMGLLTQKIDPLPYLLGLESRAEYLTRRLGGHYLALEQLDQTLPAEARVVFLWEPRSYYCHRDCRPDSILDEFPHLVYHYGTAEAIAQAWQEAGITHVLVHRTGLEFMLNEMPDKIDQEVLKTLEKTYWHEVFDVGGAYQVYQLKEDD